MKHRFILYRRKLGGMFYIGDSETRKQESLGTKDRAAVPELNNVIANLELLPLKLNEKKNDKVGEGQVSLAEKLHAAGCQDCGR